MDPIRIGFLAIACVFIVTGVLVFAFRGKIRLNDGNRSPYARKHPRNASLEDLRFVAVLMVVIGVVGIFLGLFAKLRGDS